MHGDVGVHPHLHRPHRQTRVEEEASIDTPCTGGAQRRSLVNWRQQGAATIGHLHRAEWTMYMWPPPPSAGLHELVPAVLMSSMGDEVLVHPQPGRPRHRGRFHRHRIPLSRDAGHGRRVRRHAAAVATDRQPTAVGRRAGRGLRIPTARPRPSIFAGALRKVELLERTLAGKDAWITGTCRADAPTCSDIDVVTLDTKRSMVKINPMAMMDRGARRPPTPAITTSCWSAEVDTSIGCAPCTRPTAPGDDPRAGRWAGKGKTECGLHVWR